MSLDHKTSFGYQTVTPQEKTIRVDDLFKRVAGRYDLMNDLMSFGIHRWWKQKLIDMIRLRPQMQLLDVAGGTGDIALRALRALPTIQATVCDRNPAMINEGRNKAIDSAIIGNINWICGDAASLPLQDDAFDTYTISFGLRNVTAMQEALNEAHRVLKPGGQFFCLEFSKVANVWFKKIYDEYSFRWIPKLGSLIAGDQDAYQYLVESIACFPNQETLVSMLQTAGFHQVSYQNLTDGVVAIHSGIKI